MTADALDGDEVGQTIKQKTLDDPVEIGEQGHCEKHKIP